MHDKRNEGKMLDSSDGYNHSTERMLNRYLQGKAQLKYDTPSDVFPCDLINSEECRPPSSYA
jgi:glucose-6-phosphate isomerase